MTNENATAASNIGFPQLDPSSYASQVFWLAVAFVVLYFLMSRIALPRIAEVLDMRHKQREGNLTRAEEMREETERVKTTYEQALTRAQDEAQQRLTAMEASIAQSVAEENTKFIEKARAKIAESEGAIAKAKSEALASLPELAAEVTAEIVQKVAGLDVQKSQTRAAVDSILERKEA